MNQRTTPAHGKKKRSTFNTKDRRGFWLQPHPAHEALVAGYKPLDASKNKKED